MTQTEQILAHLRSGLPITGIEALNRFNCFRLAARIAELRHEGHEIEMRTISRGGKHFAEYRLRRRPKECCSECTRPTWCARHKRCLGEQTNAFLGELFAHLDDPLPGVAPVGSQP